MPWLLSCIILITKPDVQQLGDALEMIPGTVSVSVEIIH
jgi:hypothetical protein